MGLKEQFQAKAERLEKQAQKAKEAAGHEAAERGGPDRQPTPEAVEDTRDGFQD